MRQPSPCLANRRSCAPRLCLTTLASMRWRAGWRPTWQVGGGRLLLHACAAHTVQCSAERSALPLAEALCRFGGDGTRTFPRALKHKLRTMRVHCLQTWWTWTR